MKVLLSFCKAYKGSFGWVFALNLLIGVTELSLPLLLMRVINEASRTTNGDWVRISVYLAAYVVILGLGTLLKYLNQNAANKLSMAVSRDLRLDLFGRLIQRPFFSLKGKASGDLVSTLTNNVMSVEQFVKSDLQQFIYQPFRFLGATVFMLFINWKLLLASLLVLPVSLWLSQKTVKSISSVARKLADQTAALTSTLQETHRSIKTVKAYQLNKWLSDQYHEQTRTVRVKELGLEKKLSALIPLQIVLSALPYALCVIFGGYLALKQQMNIGELVSFLQLLNLIVRPLSMLPRMMANAKRFGGVLSRITEYYGETVGEVKEQMQYSKHAAPLVVEQLAYAYDGQKALMDISFAVEHPGMTTIAGRSGSGKSTLLQLLCGYDKPESGRILLFGHDLNHINPEGILPLVAFVPQEHYIFPATIYENIAYGRVDASRNEVLAAARAAGVDLFADDWPDGYETRVSNDSLSGGQKQRISIARAFLKGAPLLFLDEPTSALDIAAEQNLLNSLAEWKKERTIIIVSHRPAVVKAGDTVLLLEQGRLLAAGTYEELRVKTPFILLLEEEGMGVGT